MFSWFFKHSGARMGRGIPCVGMLPCPQNRNMAESGLLKSTIFPDSLSLRCGLAMISGLVFAAAYPPLGWGWLVVPGLAGLLLALQGQHGTRARTIGFLHGLVAYSAGLSWLYEIFGVMVIALWFVLAAFHALFAEMLSRAVTRGMSGWLLAAFAVANWSAWEFIRAEVFPLKFPWMTVGLAIGPNRLLPWIGVYGVGAVIVSSIFLLVAGRWKAALVPAALCLVAWATVSNKPVSPPNDSMSVSIAGLQWENIPITDYIQHTKELPDDIRYVVWPEYAVPFDIRANKRDWNHLLRLCRERDITLTFGTQRHHGPERGWSNIALTIDANGVCGEHNKVHTVHFFDDGNPGRTALPVDTRHGKIGTPVCFDCDYEGVTRRMTNAGAEMFIVPIMDAQSWTARQHDQHAELFRIRACENGRWMFVCATSGVSQVIDPQGRVLARMAALDQGALIGTIHRETKLTFYTRFGWLIPWGLLGIAAAFWTILVMPVRWMPRWIFPSMKPHAGNDNTTSTQTRNESHAHHE